MAARISSRQTVAIYDKKQDYDDIVTRGLPLGNDGRPLTNQIISFGPVIPKGAKNVALAKEFLRYAVQPKVLNHRQGVQAGRGNLRKISDPAGLKRDHRMRTVVPPARRSFSKEASVVRHTPQGLPGFGRLMRDIDSRSPWSRRGRIVAMIGACWQI